MLRSRALPLLDVFGSLVSIVPLVLFYIVVFLSFSLPLFVFPFVSLGFMPLTALVLW
jgi:hypothetical protein